MHASDDHEGVGRIPVRAKKVVKAVRAKKNGQWGIQVWYFPSTIGVKRVLGSHISRPP